MSFQERKVTGAVFARGLVDTARSLCAAIL